jgi:hypothetical protein
MNYVFQNERGALTGMVQPVDEPIHVPLNEWNAANGREWEIGCFGPMTRSGLGL